MSTSAPEAHIFLEAAPFGSGAFQSVGGNRRREPRGTRMAKNRTPITRNANGTSYGPVPMRVVATGAVNRGDSP